MAIPERITSVHMSKIVESIIGSPDVISCRRSKRSKERIMHNFNTIDSIEPIVIGSMGDGFEIQGTASDLDFMYVYESYPVSVCTHMHACKIQGRIRRRNEQEPRSYETEPIYQKESRVSCSCMSAIKTPLQAHYSSDTVGYAYVEYRHSVNHTGGTIDVPMSRMSIAFQGRVLVSSTLAALYALTGSAGEVTGPSRLNMQEYEGYQNDNVLAFPCTTFPAVAYEWMNRNRKYESPSAVLISEVVNKGCHFIPVGERESSLQDMKWRTSFVIGEQMIFRSLTHLQFKVDGLMKLFKSHVLCDFINPSTCESTLTSYHIKTVMMWAVENTPVSLWEDRNFMLCLQHCLKLLKNCIVCGFLPNYFMPSCNLFRRIPKSDELLISHVSKIIQEPTLFLLKIPLLARVISIFFEDEGCQDTDGSLNFKLFYTCETQSVILSHFSAINDRKDIIKPLVLLRRTCEDIDSLTDVQYCLLIKRLAFALMTSKHIEVNETLVNKIAYQQLRRVKHSYMLRTQMDAVSGWLYLANYYYVTAQYVTAQILIQKALKSISTLHMYHGRIKDMGKFMETILSTELSFYDQLKVFLTTDVILYSDIICPAEISGEIDNLFLHFLPVPSRVYAYFLSCLCGYHTRDQSLQRSSVRALKELIYDGYYGIRRGYIYEWILVRLVAICYELMGDKENCSHFYEESDKIKKQNNKDPYYADGRK